MKAQQMLDQAINELSNLNPGEKFIVKDLFIGYIWNRCARSERLLLGTLFLNYVKQNLNKINLLDKTSSGQQQYKII